MQKVRKSWLKIVLTAALTLITGAFCNAGERTLKPPDRKILREIDQRINLFRSSLTGRMLNRVLFQTGLYHAFWWRRPPHVFKRCEGRKQQQELKVVTANLLLFPPPLADGQEKQIEDFANAIRSFDPDVILLQEVWDNNSIILLADIFAGYNMVFSPASIYNRSGLVTFSRHEIVSAEFIMFPMQIHHNAEELLAQKGFLLTRLKAGTGEMMVINTHLYSAPIEKAYRPNPRQFLFLQKAAMNSGKIPLLVGGDLNLKPDEMRRNLLLKLVPDNCQLPTAGLPERTQKLDHILFWAPAGLNYKFSAGRAPDAVKFSDHAAIMGTLKFKN